MATGAALAAIVLRIVQDDGFDEDDVLYQFNQCANYLSSEFILPALDTQGTVTTDVDTWSVDVPADFQRNLYEVLDSNNRPIGILDSRKPMLAYCGGDIDRTAARIERVTVIGGKLIYWPINVTAEELTLFYQRKPSAITALGTIDLLPSAFADSDQFFVNYACWKLFEQIEQGLEGTKVDTNYYMALFTGMVDKLSLHLNKESGISYPRPKVVRMQRW